MNTEAIITTVCVCVAFFLCLGLYVIISKHNKKKEALKCLLQLDEQIKKVNIKAIRGKHYISGLTYDEKLLTMNIELPFPMFRLAHTIILIQHYLDFTKHKNIEIVQPQKIVLKLTKDELTYQHNGTVTTILYKNIFYLKGYYEYHRNALFINFVEYDHEHELKIQITSLRDFVLLSSIIADSSH